MLWNKYSLINLVLILNSYRIGEGWVTGLFHRGKHSTADRQSLIYHLGQGTTVRTRSRNPILKGQRIGTLLDRCGDSDDPAWPNVQWVDIIPQIVVFRSTMGVVKIRGPE